jgi:hypothetical protein
MRSSRMAACQAVTASTTEFIKRRPGDAIGLVVFSNNAYVRARPKTLQNGAAQVT